MAGALWANPKCPWGGGLLVGGLAENHPACEMLKGPFATKLSHLSNRQSHFTARIVPKFRSNNPRRFNRFQLRLWELEVKDYGKLSSRM